MKNTVRVPIIMRIPPPLIFVAVFFMGFGLQQLVPITLNSTNVISAGHMIGLGLVICGGLLALSCVGIFLGARTTIIPFGSASSLVTRGPYRLTRNPMYVSLMLAYLGVVGLLIQPWSLFLLPLPVAVMHTVVIPFEEARLREVFGSEFHQYCANVRR